MYRFDILAQRIFGHKGITPNCPDINQNQELISLISDGISQCATKNGEIYRIAGRFLMEGKTDQEFAQYLKDNAASVAEELCNAVFACIKANNVDLKDFYDSDSASVQDDLIVNQAVAELGENMTFPYIAAASLLSMGKTQNDVAQYVSDNADEFALGINALLLRHLRHPKFSRRLNSFFTHSFE